MATNENLVENINSSEKFYNEHKKTIWSVVAAVLVVVAAILAYNKWVYQPACTAAQEAAYSAESSFISGEYQLALEGDGNVLGLADVCSQYGSKAGKAVYFEAAVCAYQLGNYEDALSYIKKYSTSDKILGARAIAFKGDCLASLEQTAKAAKCFEAAAKKADNAFAGEYLLKAGIAYEALGNNAKALKCYTSVKEDYAQSFEAYEIDKYIERVK